MAPWQDAHGGQAQPGGGMEREAETLRNEWRLWGLLGCPLAVCVGTRGTQPPCGEPGEIIQSRHKSVVADYVCEMSPNVLRESANEFAEPPLIKELIF